MKYETITEVLDFGPNVTKMILKLDHEVDATAFDPKSFNVHVVREDNGPEVPWPVFMGPKPDMQMEGDRSVEKAYISDECGNKVNHGRNITLTFKCHPNIQLGSIMVFNGIFNVFVDFTYTAKVTGNVTLSDGTDLSGKVFDEKGKNHILLGDLMIEGLHEDPEIPLKYTYYDPKCEGATYKKQDSNAKYPLLIWLHGAGEGGDEPLLAVIGNKVVNLISEEIQKIFDGAYLLAPQAPTMWMDDGTGEYTKDGSTKYLAPLDRLICDFIKEHDDIDTSRIYIGGDSNGGFMTMKQIIYHTDLYAAAYPVCEALTNEAISDDDIAKLSKLPIWFTHSATDTTVDPELYPITTYKRLMAKGAKNVHFTFWDKLLDLTGQYKNEDGTPYEYYGHWAWIPMLNNDCAVDFDGAPVKVNGKDVHILEWLAAQKK